MIRKALIAASIFLLVMFMLLCCKKSDYRDNYTGEYVYTVNESIYNFTDSTTFDTVIYYTGQIIKNDSRQDGILINYLPNFSINAVLDENGKISKPPQSGLGWGFSGQFESQYKVSLTYYLYGTTHNAIGIKNPH
jgi:hypothetical protein